jgi:hypothetical protein
VISEHRHHLLRSSYFFCSETLSYYSYKPDTSLVTFSGIFMLSKNYATQLAPSVGTTVRTKPAEFIRQTHLKMAEENTVILINNPLPPPSGTRGIRSKICVGADGVRSQGSQRSKEVRGTRRRISHHGWYAQHQDP